MRVSMMDLREAYEFFSIGGGYEHQVYLCKETGKFYYHSEVSDDWAYCRTI